MEKEKFVYTTTTGDKPIYPTSEDNTCGGMTLREYYAGIALGAIVQAMPDIHMSVAAEAAWAHSDALLHALRQHQCSEPTETPTEEKKERRGAANGLTEDEKDAVFVKVGEILERVVSTLDKIGEDVDKM